MCSIAIHMARDFGFEQFGNGDELGRILIRILIKNQGEFYKNSEVI